MTGLTYLIFYISRHEISLAESIGHFSSRKVSRFKFLRGYWSSCVCRTNASDSSLSFKVADRYARHRWRGWKKEKGLYLYILPDLLHYIQDLSPLCQNRQGVPGRVRDYLQRMGKVKPLRRKTSAPRSILKWKVVSPRLRRKTHSIQLDESYWAPNFFKGFLSYPATLSSRKLSLSKKKRFAHWWAACERRKMYIISLFSKRYNEYDTIDSLWHNWKLNKICYRLLII